MNYSQSPLPTARIQNIEKELKLLKFSPEKILKRAIKSFDLEQKKVFFADCSNAPIAELIYQRTTLIDQIIALLWRQHAREINATIIAVGGYGRGELFPCSDIDLLILFAESENKESTALHKIMHILWDSGLDLKSNTCYLDECKIMMQEDITVMTSMLESRFIAGKWDLYQSFKNAVKQQLADDTDYVEKRKNKRTSIRNKYNDTIYVLEPNVKESPSGLRDIHTVIWVAIATLGINKLDQFVERGYLTEKEYQLFIKAKEHLWRFRFALHMLTQRDENRLLFDLQIRIAQKFAYKKKNNKHAVEWCMQNYYKQLIVIRRTCFLLLHEMNEHAQQSQHSKPLKQRVLNKRFQINENLIEMRNPYVFKRSPFALLEIFLLMQERSEIDDFSAQTSRQIIEDASIIDDQYRQDIRNKALFMEIIRRRKRVYPILQKMHEHGILSAYIKDFLNVEGLMQFDLFHIYTVDAHSLFVVRNLLDFFDYSRSVKYQLEYDTANNIAKPEILILAGLYHDIGKGTQEEHQISGSRIVKEFCIQHYLSDKDTHLVSWLVMCHLELSITAQKMNIHDPKVLSSFLTKNKPQHSTDLDYLYLLTIADIAATSPNLLNDYKHTIIKQLWQSLKKTMTQQENINHNVNREVISIKSSAMRKLIKMNFSHTKIRQYFNRWDNQYFIEQNIMDIVKQAHLVLENVGGGSHSSLAIHMEYKANLQAVELLIWVERQQYQFALIIACLDQQDYSIIRAQVKRDSESCVMYSFVVKPLHPVKDVPDEALIQKLQLSLIDLQQNNPVHLKPKKRLQDRRMKDFLIETQIYFEEALEDRQIVLNLITRDRSGLLAIVSTILSDFKVLIVGAYISTVGAKVEDKLFLLNSNQEAFSQHLKNQITKKIEQALS